MMNEKKHIIDKEGILKIRGLIDEPRVVMMATRLDRFPYSIHPKTPRYVSPMTLQQIDDYGCLWFFTSNQNSHFKDIQKNRKVQIIYSNEEKKKYVSILGHASCIPNPRKVDELWNPFLQGWFESKENPNMALFNVFIKDAHYWDSRNNKLSPLFTMAEESLPILKPNLGERMLML